MWADRLPWGEPHRSQSNRANLFGALPDWTILTAGLADNPGGGLRARVIAPNVGRLNGRVIDRSGDVYSRETGGLHLGCR